FAAASQQAVNFGTAADIQIERDAIMTIAFKIKVAANPAARQHILTNFGATDKGFAVTITTSGQIRFELRNTLATNRYSITTTNDIADNTWHDIVIRKPAIWVDTTWTIDGSLDNTATEGDNLSATIVSTEDLFLGVRETVASYFDGFIDDLAIWIGTTDPESKYPDHYWRLGEDGYVDSGVSATKLNGTPINNPTVSTDVM